MFLHNVLLQWSPVNKDIFCLVNKFEVYFFKWIDVASESERIVLLHVYRSNDNIERIAWLHPIKNLIASDNVFAIVPSTGKAFITDLYPDNQQNIDNILNPKYLVHKYSKKTLYLCVNPWKRHLLAQGLSSGRHGDTSILIWDLSSEYHKMNSSSSFNANHLDEIYQFDKPLCEFGYGETTSSFAWLNLNSLVVGLGGKYLKIFNLADLQNPSQATMTKYLNGLCVDPFLQICLASYSEDQVAIWKVDRFEKPVYILNFDSEVISIGWSPTQEGLLAVLQKNSCEIKVYDVRPIFSMNFEEVEKSLFETIAVETNPLSQRRPICSFVWNMSLIDSFVILDTDLKLKIIHRKIPQKIAWSSSQSLAWSTGNQWNSINDKKFISSNIMVQNNVFNADLNGDKNLDQDLVKFKESLKQTHAIIANDVATKMKQRCEKGYGIDPSAKSYPTIVSDSKELTGFWEWIRYLQSEEFDRKIVKEINQGFGLSNNVNFDPPTVQSGQNPFEFKIEKSMSLIEVVNSVESQSIAFTPEWMGLENSLDFPKYCSVSRTYILHLCNWPVNFDQEEERIFYNELCNQDKCLKAAAMSLIDLKFDQAINYLNRYRMIALTKNYETGQSKVDVELIILALSGYSPRNCNSNWKIRCQTYLKETRHPDIRLMFNFLICDDKDFSNILYDEAIELYDRIAFATIYLNDDKLKEYLQNLTEKVVTKGSLLGSILTGLYSKDWIELLQNYLNNSRDIQTIAIACLHSCLIQVNDKFAKNKNQNFDFISKRTSTQPINRKVTPFRDFTNKSEIPTLLKSADIRTVHWVQCYRDMLDQWMLWFARADFDIAYNSKQIYSVQRDLRADLSQSGFSKNNSEVSFLNKYLDRQNHLAPSKNIFNNLYQESNQIYVACYYCGVKLSGNRSQDGFHIKPMLKKTSTLISEQANDPSSSWQSLPGTRQNVCQNCKKPYPRCSICLMHLNGSYSLEQIKDKKNPLSPRPNPMQNWFVWCQACRHGGHAIHIIEWFNNNPECSNIFDVECPVNGCTCKCLTLDTSLEIGIILKEFIQKNNTSQTPSSASIEVTKDISQSRDMSKQPTIGESFSGEEIVKMMGNFKI